MCAPTCMCCVCPSGGEGGLSDPSSPVVRRFGTETPWDEMTHHNAVLMRDTHAGLAPVQEEIGQWTPTCIATTLSGQQTKEGLSSRGEGGWETAVVGIYTLYFYIYISTTGDIYGEKRGMKETENQMHEHSMFWKDFAAIKGAKKRIKKD